MQAVFVTDIEKNYSFKKLYLLCLKCWVSSVRNRTVYNYFFILTKFAFYHIFLRSLALLEATSHPERTIRSNFWIHLIPHEALPYGESWMGLLVHRKPLRTPRCSKSSALLSGCSSSWYSSARWSKSWFFSGFIKWLCAGKPIFASQNLSLAGFLFPPLCSLFMFDCIPDLWEPVALVVVDLLFLLKMGHVSVTSEMELAKSGIYR